jgi:hypothetical protein
MLVEKNVGVGERVSWKIVFGRLSIEFVERYKS